MGGGGVYITLKISYKIKKISESEQLGVNNDPLRGAKSERGNNFSA